MSYQPAAPYESRTYRHYTISTMDYLNTVTVSTNPASTAWPLANLAIYVPIYINEPCTIYQVGTGAGLTAGGNFDIGLYQMDGTKVQSTGTQARTASAWNAVDWTDLDVSPGWYYAAMAANGVDNYCGVAPAAGLCEAFGIAEQTTAFVLPSPATITTRTTRAFVPNIVFVLRSVAI
jgi:hypothetical protein